MLTRFKVCHRGRVVFEFHITALFTPTYKKAVSIATATRAFLKHWHMTSQSIVMTLL